MSKNARHARPNENTKLANLRLLFAKLTESYRRGEVDESSFKRLAKSYKDDIAEEERKVS